MRYKLLGIIILLIIMASPGMALTTSTEAVAKVTVASVFELSLDRNDIDFQSMTPGEVKYDIPQTGIRVTTKTNTGNTWYLKINTVSELRYLDQIIDNKHFYWYGWTEGKGTWLGTGEDSFTNEPVLVYESGPGEEYSYPDGTHNILKFKLDVPESQPAGYYETIVQITITE